ncbi:MAG: hypothetical protein ABIE94_01645, partial [archaeon]
MKWMITIVIVALVVLVGCNRVIGGCGSVGPNSRDACCHNTNQDMAVPACEGGWKWNTETNKCGFVCGFLNPAADTHVCTYAEKENMACTMEYVPVCGDDGNLYGNGCSACSSGNVDSYVMGECEDEPLLGSSCGTVTPGYNDECCERQNEDPPVQCKGEWKYNFDIGECEYVCPGVPKGSYICTEEEKQVETCTQHANAVCGDNGE